MKRFIKKLRSTQLIVHLGKQGTEMSTDKVIVFIVEGISEKESLEAILSELFKDKNIVFSVVGGDITTENSSNTNNIQNKIVKKIKEAMNRDKFIKSDIKKVVHLVDMDGAYIPSSNVIKKDVPHPIYTNNNIETNNVENIIQRNNKKVLILNKLSTMKKIYNNIDYSIYYMSCNLEHVLHNIRNADNDTKISLAEEIEDKYYDNPEEFVKFIKDNSFAVKGDYSETWNFIKKNLNSLNRYSNFGLFFT